MNILHLQLSGNPGGIVTLCRAIANNSNNINHMYFLQTGGSVAETMKNEGIPVVVANANRFLWRKSIVELIDYCKENSIDVLINHSNSPVACTHAIAIHKKLRNITILTYLHSDANDMIHTFKQKIMSGLFIKRLQSRAKNVIAISEFVKQSGIDALKIQENKIKVIYNGVDYQKFSGFSVNKQNHGCLEIIFVGRLFWAKGVDLLVKAVSLLKNHIPLHVTIVGVGPDKEALENQCVEEGISGFFDFLGLRMDIGNLLSKADVFIHPAICNEGFGITLIEAMAVGLPCIAFNRGAMPEIIQDHKNGLIVPEVSAESLAEKIKEFYKLFKSEKYKNMVEEARLTGLKFDIHNTVRNLENLY